MVTYWYLSFAGRKKCHGGVLVKAKGPKHALEVVNQHGLNPGGEVMILPVPEDREEFVRKHLYKLLPTPTEVAIAFGDDPADMLKYGELTPSQKAHIDSMSSGVCEKDNKVKT